MFKEKHWESGYSKMLLWNKFDFKHSPQLDLTLRIEKNTQVLFLGKSNDY